jgi:hypothetical protein
MGVCWKSDSGQMLTEEKHAFSNRLHRPRKLETCDSGLGQTMVAKEGQLQILAHHHRQ